MDRLLSLGAFFGFPVSKAAGRGVFAASVRFYFFGCIGAFFRHPEMPEFAHFRAPEKSRNLRAQSGDFYLSYSSSNFVSFYPVDRTPNMFLV